MRKRANPDFARGVLHDALILRAKSKGSPGRFLKARRGFDMTLTVWMLQKAFRLDREAAYNLIAYYGYTSR